MINLCFQAAYVIELNDAFAVGGVGELEAENLGVLFGLLQSVAGRFVCRFSFDHSDQKVAGEAPQVIGALLWTAIHSIARDHNAAIGEGLLLVERMRLPVPARFIEFGQNVRTASISFSNHRNIHNACVIRGSVMPQELNNDGSESYAKLAGKLSAMTTYLLPETNLMMPGLAIGIAGRESNSMNSVT